MGTYHLIDRYLEEFADATRWHPDRDNLLAEMSDHLESATEELARRGADPESAQRAALARFGQPDAVARSLAVGPRGRPAVPTPSTVSGGMAPLVAAGLCVLHAVAALAVIHLYDRIGDSSDPESSSPLQIVLMTPWAMGLMGAVALILVSGIVIRERQGGLGWYGLVGLAALGLAVPATLGVWAVVVWAPLVAVGTAALAVELARFGAAPRRCSVALGVAAPVGFAVFGILRLMELGSADQYGDFPLATSAGITFGAVMLAGGLISLGRWLRSEEPAAPELWSPATQLPATT